MFEKRRINTCSYTGKKNIKYYERKWFLLCFVKNYGLQSWRSVTSRMETYFNTIKIGMAFHGRFQINYDMLF